MNDEKWHSIYEQKPLENAIPKYQEGGLVKDSDEVIKSLNKPLKDKLKIVSDGIKTEVFINDIKIEGIISVVFSHNVPTEMAELSIKLNVIGISLKGDK